MDSYREKVLLTGASGFVGGAVLRDLERRGTFDLRVATRDLSTFSGSAFEAVSFSGLDAKQDWTQALEGVDLVVHSAARVHVMKEQVADSMTEFRKVNVDGTLKLASQAATAGVKRFIFISSIKVNGEGTHFGAPYTAESATLPVDEYGISKLEAETGLFNIAANSSMEVVIIRPVLVYGPGVKANFLNMMRVVEKGIPLPFGRINNKRSLVSLDNLVDFIFHCMTHPAASNQVFLVSDGEDLSTSELLRKIANAMGKKSRLVPVPVGLLKLVAQIFGQKKLIDRLCGSLQVDIKKNKQILGWTPPFSIDDALIKTAKDFKGNRN